MLLVLCEIQSDGVRLLEASFVDVQWTDALRQIQKARESEKMRRKYNIRVEPDFARWDCGRFEALLLLPKKLYS